MRRLALSAIAVLAAWLGSAGAAGAAPALWRVSVADTQVYLFGTIHALASDAGWRTPLYEHVLADAGTVWFETDLSSGDPDTLRLLVQRYGSDPDRPLSRRLAPADLNALSRQTDVRRIDHLRPWVAALMLSVQPTFARGASVEKGADLSATRTARGEAKQIRTFETLEDQVRMFASLPEPSQMRYLTDVIHERKGGRRLRPSAPVSLEAAWRQGDLLRLGVRLVDEMKAKNPPLYDALLRRRNLAWADQLSAEMAANPGVELVNVGALHLVGEDGLPALLAARGYRVERVQ
jgi:uncharacterized protein YbaP (TraB family)